MDRSERERLGLYFKTLATQRELKQRDIARKIGHERSMISKIFGGSIQADEPYERVAEFFGTTLEQAQTSATALAAALGVMASGEEAEDAQEAARGAGLGRLVLEECFAVVRERGGSVLWCNARLVAVPFYARLGMAPVGPEFDIPGIGPHYVMWREV